MGAQFSDVMVCSMIEIEITAADAKTRFDQRGEVLCSESLKYPSHSDARATQRVHRAKPHPVHLHILYFDNGT